MALERTAHLTGFSAFPWVIKGEPPLTASVRFLNHVYVSV
jgi:hypothetical protein